MMYAISQIRLSQKVWQSEQSIRWQSQSDVLSLPLVSIYVIALLTDLCQSVISVTLTHITLIVSIINKNVVNVMSIVQLVFVPFHAPPSLSV